MGKQSGAIGMGGVEVLYEAASTENWRSIWENLGEVFFQQICVVFCD